MFNPILQPIKQVQTTTNKQATNQLNFQRDNQTMASTEGPVAAISHLASQYKREFVEHYDNTRRRLQTSSIDFKARVSQTTESLKEAEQDAEKRMFLSPLKNVVSCHHTKSKLII